MKNSTENRNLTGARKWNFGCMGPNLPQRIFLLFLVAEYMPVGRVMLRVNLWIQRKLVNGSLGTVEVIVYKCEIRPTESSL